ncbi:hypothetical protein DFH06DRAFT_1311454 [Mycena polygramma]|nr:hypothetical protein DFH06DRAFT_1311454 [Mycena polygramma]
MPLEDTRTEADSGALDPPAATRTTQNSLKGFQLSKVASKEELNTLNNTVTMNAGAAGRGYVHFFKVRLQFNGSARSTGTGTGTSSVWRPASYCPEVGTGIELDSLTPGPGREVQRWQTDEWGRDATRRPQSMMVKTRRRLSGVRRARRAPDADAKKQKEDGGVGVGWVLRW